MAYIVPMHVKPKFTYLLTNRTHDDFMAEMSKETSVYWKWIWESLIQNTQISSIC